MMSIGSEISRLSTAKANLKSAIEAKGVSVSGSVKLDGYPELVGEISQANMLTVFTLGVEASDDLSHHVEDSVSVIEKLSKTMEYRFVSIGSVDLTTGKTATADSINSGSQSAAKAIDDSNVTEWLSNSSPYAYHWLKVDFGAGNEKRIGSIRIKTGSYSMNGIDIAGSNDDSTWTLLKNASIGTNTDTTWVLPLIDYTAYRYVRVIQTGQYYSSGLVELEIFELILGDGGTES
jgi:hypothetical protein